jgi:predicted DNA-binding protein with PD1-like motif
VKQHGIEAGWVETAVGSLTRLELRYANAPEGTVREGHFEIVGLTGTVSVNGSHLHLAAADETGQVIGGHLLTGNAVYTTAEIVLGEAPDQVFTREHDGSTPWKELQIRSR